MKAQIPTQYSHSVIYGLVDPRNQEVKYIGSTKKPVQFRYNQHLNMPLNSLRAWITELRDQQLIPILTLFETTNLATRFIREAKYIHEHRPGVLNARMKYRGQWLA